MKPLLAGGVMNCQRTEQGLSSIVATASFISRINNKTKREKAFDLMVPINEDSVQHQASITLLCINIEITTSQNNANQLITFKQRLPKTNSSISTLAKLMQQHNLDTTDFQNEIGGKQ
jgi:HTH-type transcriptional regulator/antitoxin HigA